MQKYTITQDTGAQMRVALRGCDELLVQAEFAQKLARSQATGIPLRIKLGLDPTAPDIHLGHTVVLNKMRQLQDLGHTVIFLIGDFTSMIGDPSGRNTTRPPLTREQIAENAKTYYAQASLVLDPAKTEIRYNSEWCDPLGARGIIQLAQEIITRFHSKQAAQDALANFEARFRDGAIPENLPEMTLSGAPLGVLKVLREAGLVASGAEAQRNVEQGGVKIDSVKVEDKGLQLPAGTYVIQVGKRKFARVTLA